MSNVQLWLRYISDSCTFKVQRFERNGKTQGEVIGARQAQNRTVASLFNKKIISNDRVEMKKSLFVWTLSLM